MKLLILSFFAVILGYSLLFDNDKEEIRQPIHGIDNSVYIQKSDTQRIDSLELYRDQTAYAL